jgi:hypothetical protein
MATTAEHSTGARAAVGGAGQSADSLVGRRARPIVFWAIVGAAFVALQLYIYLSWLTSGDATRVDTGTDKLNTATEIWVQFFQALSIVAAIAIVFVVVRQSLRQRSLSFDAMLVIAWVSLYWQDPIINYVRTGFFYNSAFVNIGSWTEHIPGWVSPNGHLLPEPVAFVGALYFWLGPAASLLTYWVMRRAKARWPRLGAVGLVATAWIVMVALDLLCELIWVRTTLYAYSGAIHGLSIWGGERYQFPIYESVLWPMVWTSMGALKYFRDDKGRSVVERGVDRVRAVRWRTPLRVLAIIGFANIAMLTYNIAFQAFVLHNDKTPSGYPTYLRNGLCGEGTRYACNGPEIPIPLPRSSAVPPGGTQPTARGR